MSSDWTKQDVVDEPRAAAMVINQCLTEAVKARARISDLTVKIKRLQAIVDKMPAWVNELVQAQNQLHGIQHAGMGKKSIEYVERAIQRAIKAANTVKEK